MGVDALPHTVRRRAVPRPPSTPVSTVSRAGPSHQVASSVRRVPPGPLLMLCLLLLPNQVRANRFCTLIFREQSLMAKGLSQGGSTSPSSQPRTQPKEPKVDKEPKLPVCTPEVLVPHC